MRCSWRSWRLSVWPTSPTVWRVVIKLKLTNDFSGELTLSDFNTGKEFSMRRLEAGAKATDVSTTDRNGKQVKLKDYLGKKVVLYFYPKDDTPGCTKEACAFRDHFSEFRKQGVEILG